MIILGLFKFYMSDCTEALYTDWHLFKGAVCKI